MKKITAFILLVFFMSSSSWAQDTSGVFIGYEDKSPNVSAILDIDVENKGILLPRLTTVQRDSIINPSNGLVIFNTDSRKIEYYDIPGWNSLSVVIWQIDTSGSVSIDSVNVGVGMTNSDKAFNVIGDFRIQSGNLKLESPLGLNSPFQTSIDTSEIKGVGFVNIDSTNNYYLLNGLIDLMFFDSLNVGYGSVKGFFNVENRYMSIQAVEDGYNVFVLKDTVSQSLVNIEINHVGIGVIKNNFDEINTLALYPGNIDLQYLLNDTITPLRNRLVMRKNLGIELSLDQYGQNSDKISSIGFRQDEAFDIYGVFDNNIEAMASDTSGLKRIKTGALADTSDYRVYFDDSLHSAYTQVKLDKNGLEVYAGDYSQGDSSSLLKIDAQRLYYDKDIQIGREQFTDIPRLYVMGKGNDSTTVALSIYNSSNDSLLTILDNGYVGIGTGTPTESLDVDGNIVSSGTITASCGVLSCSDQRYKTNFKPLPDALSRINNLKGLYFTYRDKEFPEMRFNERQQIGLIAQELNKEFPELVDTMSNGYLSVNYAQLSVVLLEALKEQSKIIEEKRRVNEALKEEVNQLEGLREDYIQRMIQLEALFEINSIELTSIK